MRIDESLLNKVIEIAKLAGEQLLTIYNQQTPLDIRNKQDDSPVTIADLAAHEIIQHNLLTLFSHIPVLSEEDPDFDFEARRYWQSFWLVDPLDGTKEFINRSGDFTVNIALINNTKPILGVIYIPLKNEIYYAANGLGAFKQSGEKKSAIRTKQWQSGAEIVLFATRQELQADLSPLLTAYGKLTMAYKSSSLKFCLLAEGLADIYLRKKPIHEWDTAAGQCIVEEAGGIVLDSNWKTLRYNTKPHLLNPPFIAVGDRKQLLPILKSMPMF